MTGAVVILLAVAVALLAAASLRLPGLVSTLLAAYLALVVNLVGVVLALSPFREVTRAGLAAAEGALLLAAVAAWWLRGRPGIPLAPVGRAVRELSDSPLALVFVAVVGLLLAYELVLALTVPPDNYDSLTYHLVRAAAWVQHGGVYWVANAPTDRINEFQPLAEQELLFLFAATGSGSLFALPQYVAGLAAILAVYGASRRLGFDLRSAVCGACLLATFTLVAIEATTAQNDLVAASFPVVAAFFLLGSGALEPALAGLAVAFGLATKLTTGLVLPVLVWLALLRGRRTLIVGAVGGVLGLVAIGMWSFVLNDVHTGHLLGHGGGRVEVTTSPSYPGSIATAVDVLYASMDLSALSNRLIEALWITGIVLGLGVAAYAIRRTRSAAGVGEGLTAAVPFLAPILAIAGGGILAFIGRRWGFPVRGGGGMVGGLTRSVGEDFSAFGPIGAVTLLGVPALTVVRYARGRAGSRHLAFATAVPVFLVLLVLQAKWNEFLTRFMLVPVVLAAPLLALLFRTRIAIAAYLIVATIVAGGTITHLDSKPLSSIYGRPWQLTQEQALTLAVDPALASAVGSLDRILPPHACIGAVLGTDEPAYVLFGPRFEHRVVFLSVNGGTELNALSHGLFYVVISTGPNRSVTSQFRAAGWRIRSLDGYWTLASEPHATTGECAA